MKLNFDLKKLDFIKKYTSNVVSLILIFLGIVILLVVWVISGEVGRVRLSYVDSGEANSLIVRIDQAKNKQLQEMLENNAHFVPKPVPHAEVFSSPPDSKVAQ